MRGKAGRIPPEEGLGNVEVIGEKMNFPDLKDFILKKMRMAHIYQPVMLLTLLQAKGECSEEEIKEGIPRSIRDDGL